MLTAGIILGRDGHSLYLFDHAGRVLVSSRRRLREAAFGAWRHDGGRWCWGVVVPYTRTAVVGGIFLGLGRALGETMAVTFVLGNAHRSCLAA